MKSSNPIRIWSKTWRNFSLKRIYGMQISIWRFPILLSVQVRSGQSLSRVRLFATPWIQHSKPPCPSPTPGVYPNSCLSSQWCHSAISSSVVPFSTPPIPPSIRVFSNESTLCMRWPKYWSFSFSISSSNEHPGLISFRMDWLDLLVVQGTLKREMQIRTSVGCNYTPIRIAKT